MILDVCVCVQDDTMSKHYLLCIHFILVQLRSVTRKWKVFLERFLTQLVNFMLRQCGFFPIRMLKNLQLPGYQPLFRLVSGFQIYREVNIAKNTFLKKVFQKILVIQHKLIGELYIKTEICLVITTDVPQSFSKKKLRENFVFSAIFLKI